MEPSECFAHFAQAVEAAGRAAGPGLAAASGLVLECRGLVACSGVGKSGMVARRLASSLASAGRRATWLDPGAAAHGDAGLLRRDDLLVVISRSGESDEVLALALAAPCPVLVLTARPGSRLGRAARQVLDCGAVADPPGAPPTASALAASSVADALVLAVCGRSRGVAAAAHHPAGALGRARTIPVERVMHPPPVVAPSTPMPALLAAISQHGLGAVLLVQGERLSGIVTDGDLRRAVERLGDGALAATAAEIATLDPVTVRASAPLGQALSLMEDRPSQISVLPVLNEQGGVVGLVRIHDLVQAGLG